MEGIEKAVPSVELTEKLQRLFKEAEKSIKLDEKTKKEVKYYLHAKTGAPVSFRVIRSVLSALNDEGTFFTTYHELISYIRLCYLQLVLSSIFFEAL